MNALLIIGLLLLVLAQMPRNAQEQPGLEVLSLRVKTQVLSPPSDRLSEEPPDSVTRPNPNVNRPNRNETETERIERQTNQRVQNMHVLENMKHEGNSPRPSTLWVYESEAEIRNNSPSAITGFVWAYRASPALQYTEDQEFLCIVKVTAGENKRVKVMSVYPNQKVVNVPASGEVSNPVKPTLKDVLINEVRFSDGTTWRRPNWDPAVLTRLGATKLGSGKCVQF